MQIYIRGDILNKSFNVVESKVKNALNKNEFSEQFIESGVIFVSNSVSYKIEFKEEQKKFELSKNKSNKDSLSENWKLLSTWLFDPNENTVADAENIANDFIETILSNSNKQVKKAAKRNDTNEGVNPMFLMNRFVSIFPELKDDIKEEKEYYNEFRFVTFTKEKIVPRVHNFISTNRKDKIKKFCNLLNDMYEQGDLDVQSIIMVVILGSISDDKQVELLRNNFNDNLNKAWSMSLKFKGKKIKPEKIKKKSNVWAKTLSQK